MQDSFFSVSSTTHPNRAHTLICWHELRSNLTTLNNWTRCCFSIWQAVRGTWNCEGSSNMCIRERVWMQGAEVDWWRRRGEMPGDKPSVHACRMGDCWPYALCTWPNGMIGSEASSHFILYHFMRAYCWAELANNSAPFNIRGWQGGCQRPLLSQGLACISCYYVFFLGIQFLEVLAYILL